MNTDNWDIEDHIDRIAWDAVVEAVVNWWVNTAAIEQPIIGVDLLDGIAVAKKAAMTADLLFENKAAQKLVSPCEPPASLPQPCRRAALT